MRFLEIGFEDPDRVHRHRESVVGLNGIPGQLATFPRPSCVLQSSFSPHSVQERPFPCYVDGCCMSFKRADHMRRHARIHTGAKPFQCPIAGCKRSFMRSDTLSGHIKSHRRRQGKPGPMLAGAERKETDVDRPKESQAHVHSASEQLSYGKSSLKSMDIRFLLADPDN